jgi:hypothetical protein
MKEGRAVSRPDAAEDLLSAIKECRRSPVLSPLPRSQREVSEAPDDVALGAVSVGRREAAFEMQDGFVQRAQLGERPAEHRARDRHPPRVTGFHCQVHGTASDGERASVLAT